MAPEQTTDKKFAFMYSQCQVDKRFEKVDWKTQAIHARSILPCMDSPCQKFTYTAKVIAPASVTVLMSAVTGAIENKGNERVFHFEQKVTVVSEFSKQLKRFRCPFPAIFLPWSPAFSTSAIYRLAVRCTRSHQLSRALLMSSSVNEREMIAKRDAPSDTDKMLSAAEKLLGEYVWGRYDLLVLPNTFPFGGMENPCLTFVTPTLLVGDRSLVNVIAHEIAHSWTGNLVTNSNWEHFW